MNRPHGQKVWEWKCQECPYKNWYVCEPEDAAKAVEHGVDDKCFACGAKVELRLQGTNGGEASVTRSVA